MYVRTRMFMCVYVNERMHMYVYMYLHVCMSVCVFMCVYMYVFRVTAFLYIG